ncbi:MAG TPA: right-handed parallel beta-helix repeat-containing protein [Trinickia sp.]|uniref:right-handed parallel beta-helix repeat-containing protein n=1 Tax=Trinickia sp. TaxID=2571163 RepID=UPI002CC2C0D5|nr:right-handed parallel beta-helix repeat-containing protein [Trinickia sp.]HVW53281.1 right-handed parallel beta-helix repeat-containing protein [Trinickia sp.]
MSMRPFTVISVALAAFLAACGGGSSSSDVATSGSSTSGVSNTGSGNSGISSSTGSTSSSTSPNTSSASLAASAHYVSTSGNDANPGASSAPWRTIQHAANTAHAGDTVYVRGGTYKEAVTINVSGSASGGYITFQNYPGETAIVDGTGLVPPSGQSGLFNIIDRSYIKIVGLEIRNYSTASTARVPVGVWITGASTNIQILSNHIHHIANTAQSTNANAMGLAAYGSNATTAISQLTIDGNQIDHLTLGSSESLAVDGNVQNWSITNNVIHDSNNIGIDAIGFEGVSSSTATDVARDGTISGNTVYNITAYGNPAYGNSFGADGIYCDGCTRVTIERNVVHNTDFGVEVASEHANKLSSYVTVRSNLIYANNLSGITIGGYDSHRGGTDHCNFVNNSLYNNDTQNTGSGELQIQYFSTNNIFKNNIVYAGAQNQFVTGIASSSDVDADYNLYFSTGGAAASAWYWKGASITGFAAYRSISANEGHSLFANPLYMSLSSPNFHVAASSPAVSAGINLGSSVLGTVDFAGNPRIQGANVDIGAYEQ